MSKRETALAICRVAGYHEDKKAFTRAYIESKLNLSIATDAYNQGIVLKQRGMACTCSKCKGVI
jgi:hypothetical protein